MTLTGLALARQRCTMVTVRGHSMNPTLVDGQRLLAIRRPRYRTGDVIVFWTPDGSGTIGDPDYRVKRVIATGGQPRPAVLDGSACPPWYRPGTWRWPATTPGRARTRGTSATSPWTPSGVGSRHYESAGPVGVADHAAAVGVAVDLVP